MALRETDLFKIHRSGTPYKAPLSELRPLLTQPFVHQQPSPAAQWTVNHNRGQRPATVSILSAGGEQVDAAVTHISANQLVVTFNQPFAGSVLVA